MGRRLERQRRRMSKIAVLVALTLFSFAAAGHADEPASTSDAQCDGAKAFRRNCETCHSIRPGGVAVMHGPSLFGIYGRQAGSLPGFSYSAGLAGADFAWDEQLLEHFVSDPQAMIPGAAMVFRLADPAARACIVRWLRDQR
jgi:cytochrome c